MSKRKIGAVALLMAAIVVVSAAVTAFTGVSHRQPEGRLQVLASFYPVYVAALNVTDGVEDIALQSLAGPQTGCLHDYQLSPDNQIALEKADVLLLSGAVLTVLGIAFHRPLLYLFGASEVTYPYASSYIVIYLIGTLCVMLSLGLNPYINCQGFARTGMLTVALGAAANIVLDPIFIFALHLGVRGAAIATVLSQFLSAAWVVKFLTSKKAELKLDFRGFRPDCVFSALPCSASPASSCRLRIRSCRWRAMLLYAISAATFTSAS